MNKVEKLVDCIGPSLRYSGRKALILSIDRACRIIAEAEVGAFDRFQVTRDIYHGVASQLGRSLGTTEQAVYRAVTRCWDGGQNKTLNRIIGCSLPQKPKLSEIILYCAYFVVYGVPYQEALSHPDLPKPF